MARMVKIPELLAPVGDWKNLQAALDAGADAVYFGVVGFNMRASAKNFSSRDLSRIVAQCHERGVRAYLTANILVYEKELSALTKLLKAAAKAGVDGVIASDFAVITQAVQLGLEVHASTQMSVSNSSALLALHALGVRRFVLARECSLGDVRRIKAQLRRILGAKAEGVAIEAFAHGAMCVSVSGRCFLSEYQVGKSANRGACTQPCRREYRLVEKREGLEWQLGEGFLLSPKDLCTMPFLEKLIEAGVDSLKIEGRVRSPEYVSLVVGSYRRALDYYAANKGRKGWRPRFELLKTQLLDELGSVYNRGFSAGFYCGKPIGEWAKTAGSAAEKRKYLVGQVLNYFRKASVALVQVQDSGFSAGDELFVEGPTTGFFRQKVGELRINDRDGTQAKVGDEVTFVTQQTVRRGDKIYILR